MDTLNQTTTSEYDPALPLDNISSSPTNPRKHFDPAALAELTASIKAKGVLQPVIVRRLTSAVATSDYELVVGERRFRASKSAGLATIPATIRTLTDIEVLEIQIIENDQREDVHPMEEAEGYDRLLKSLKADGTPHTPEDIIHKIGKSRTYVYNRLKLLDLCPEGRTAFFEHGIDQSRAQMIARLGHHDTQRAALKDLLKKNYAGEPVFSARAARDHIEREYMLQLKNAPFDIKITDYTAKGKTIAGPCAPCPKRSGNSPELFGDVSGTDVCTDVKCFHAKRAAQEARVEAEFIAKGLKVITGKDAAKILPDKWNNNAASDYASENQRTPDGESTYGKIAGKSLQPIMVRRDGTDEYVKVFPMAELKKLMAEKGIKPTKPEAPRAQKQQPANDLDERVRKAAWLEARAHNAAGLMEQDWRMLAHTVLDEIFDVGDYPYAIIDLYLPPLTFGMDRNARPELHKFIDALDATAIPQFIFDCAHNGILNEGYGRPDEFAALDNYFARHQIDTKAIRARLISEDKAAIKAAEAAAKATKKPTAPVTPAIKPLLIPGNALGEKLAKKIAKKK